MVLTTTLNTANFETNKSEIFSRNSNKNFSFDNTDAGNMVEALGKIGFGKGHLSIADTAKAMALAKRIGEQKDRANKRENGSKIGSQSSSEFSKSYGGAGFDGGGWRDGRWESGSFGRKQSHYSNRDKSRLFGSKTGLGRTSRSQKSRDRQSAKK